MAKNLKPYTVPLDPDLAKEVLNIPLAEVETLVPPRTIGERLTAAVEAVEAANQYLGRSKLAAIVADTVMRSLKKRGAASLKVNPDGTVVLHVSYDEDDEEVRVVAKRPPVKQSNWHSDLPPLEELRAEADQMGVDIADLGRARRTIYERLELHRRMAAVDAEDEAAKKPPKPPARLVDEVQVGPAPSNVTVAGIRKRKGGAKTEPKTEPEGEIDVDSFLDR